MATMLEGSRPLATVPIQFSVAGVQKAATTTLYALLAGHPEIATPPRKELHVFDRRDYRPVTATQYSVRSRRAGEVMAGDFTPSYLFWPGALQRMAAVRRDMRLIAVFRDPVERAFSQWTMQASRSETYPDFDELVERWWADDYVSLSGGRWPRGKMRTHSIVPRGYYGEQMEVALRVFPRKRWLLLRFEDVTSRQQTVVDAVCRHLGIGSMTAEGVTARHPSPSGLKRPSPSPSTLARLAHAYASDLAAFERLTGVPTSDWNTLRYLRGDLTAQTWAAKLGAKLAG